MFLLAFAANVTPVAYLDRMAHQSDVVTSELEREGMHFAGIPHGPIVIDGDSNFSFTALLEGWPGDGSPENPYIIDGLDIDLGGGEGNCISISNTRVSFIISNCNLTGAYFGVYLENVINSELVNNICNDNWGGITLFESDHNTMANNTCTGNYQGITLTNSSSNTVTNNICNSNGKEESSKMGEGISIYDGSDYNTVTDNTCNSNDGGIILNDANSNTVANNTCNSNDVVGIVFEVECNYNTVVNNICTSNGERGISLHGGSDYNTLASNICNYNNIGIGLYDSYPNVVINNTCLGNTEDDVVGEFITEAFWTTTTTTTTTPTTTTSTTTTSTTTTPAPINMTISVLIAGVSVTVIIVVGITELKRGGWRMVKLSRVVSTGE
jgi:parallel beta-helix repeat protein